LKNVDFLRYLLHICIEEYKEKLKYRIISQFIIDNYRNITILLK